MLDQSLRQACGMDPISVVARNSICIDVVEVEVVLEDEVSDVEDPIARCRRLKGVEM